MKVWYTITNKADAPAEIAIFGPVGNTWDGEGVTAAQFLADFRAITSNEVNMLVNSPGGSLFDGVAIYSVMASSGKTINAKVMGVAASAASLILMAASKIEAPANTHVMVHKAGWVAAGNADDMREAADVLDSLDKSIVATYAARTGKPEADIAALLEQGDVWMTAEQAKAAGFVDEVTPLVSITNKFDLDKLPETVRLALAPPAPAPAPAATLADQIKAAVTAAGLPDLGPVLALAADITDMAGVTAAIDVAREVKARAELVGKPEMAATLVRERKTVAEANAALAAALAAEGDEVDNKPAPNNPPAKTPAAAASGPVSYWANRAAKAA